MKRLVPFLAIATLALASCGKHAAVSGPAKPSKTVQAQVVAAELQSVAAPYEAVGTVRAKVSSVIQSKVMGHVQAVNVKEGDRVEAGQVMIEIDAREAEAQVKRAESGLREAEQARTEIENALLASEHAQDAAEAGSELASATFNRFKGLAENQAVSRQLYDEADAKSKGAAAEAARAGQMVLSTRAKRGGIEARIGQAKAELNSAQTMLSFTKITAPFAGIITSKTVDVGDLAAPGAPLLALEDPRLYRLETQVDEEQLRAIAPGSTVTVMLDAGSGNLAGTVSEIVPSADPASRTSVVKIDLPQDASVRSGMFGRARFDVGERQTLAIPSTAIVQRGQLTGVYVIGDDSIARLRLVTLGKRYGDTVEVLSGLDAGERVVKDGACGVADGDLVK